MSFKREGRRISKRDDYRSYLKNLVWLCKTCLFIKLFSFPVLYHICFSVNGSDSVHPLNLSLQQVTRSIGDDDLKPAVTAEPEMTETDLSAEDEFLVWTLYFDQWWLSLAI